MLLTVGNLSSRRSKIVRLNAPAMNLDWISLCSGSVPASSAPIVAVLIILGSSLTMGCEAPAIGLERDRDGDSNEVPSGKVIVLRIVPSSSSRESSLAAR